MRVYLWVSFYGLVLSILVSIFVLTIPSPWPRKITWEKWEYAVKILWSTAWLGVTIYLLSSK